MIGVFMLAIFLIYDDDLSIAIREGNLLYSGAFLGNLIAAYYFFLTSGKNPGYLDIEKEKNLSPGVNVPLESSYSSSYNQI